jgi:hypothetical protein
MGLGEDAEDSFGAGGGYFDDDFDAGGVDSGDSAEDAQDSAAGGGGATDDATPDPGGSDNDSGSSFNDDDDDGGFDSGDDDPGLDQTPSFGGGAAGGNDPGEPTDRGDEDPSNSGRSNDPATDRSAPDGEPQPGLDQTPSFGGGAAGGNDPGEPTDRGDETPENTGRSNTPDSDRDTSPTPAQGSGTDGSTSDSAEDAQDAFAASGDAESAQDAAASPPSETGSAPPERERPPDPVAQAPEDGAGLEDRGVGTTGPSQENEDRLDVAVERLQREVDEEVPGVLAVETDEYNIVREGDQLRVELTKAGVRDARASAALGRGEGNGVVGNDQGDISDAVIEDALSGRSNPRGSVGESRSPRVGSPGLQAVAASAAVEDDPGSAEAAQDQFAGSGQGVPTQDQFVEPDAVRDPTLVRAEAQARLEARREELVEELPEGGQPGDNPLERVVANAERRTAAREAGLRQTPNDLGDTSVAVPGTDGDVRVEALLNEASAGTSEFVETGAQVGAVGVTATRELGEQREQEILEFAGGEGGFETTRGIVREFREGDPQGLATETGDEDQAQVESALSGVDALPNIPLEVASTAKEGVETGVYTTAGTPAAGGSEQEFDRRAEAAVDATATRAAQVSESAAADPARFGGSLVFGSAAEVAAVGTLARAGSAGRLASSGTTSARSAAAQTARTFTPEAPRPTAGSFLSDTRGQAQMTGVGRGDTDDAVRVADEEALAEVEDAESQQLAQATFEGSRRAQDRIDDPESVINDPADATPVEDAADRGVSAPRAPDVVDTRPGGDFVASAEVDTTAGAGAADVSRFASQRADETGVGLTPRQQQLAQQLDPQTTDLRAAVDVERRLVTDVRSTTAPRVDAGAAGVGAAAGVGVVGGALDRAAAAQEPEVDARADAGVGSEVDTAPAVDTRVDVAPGVDTRVDTEARTDVGARTDALGRVDTDLRTDVRADQRVDQRLDTRSDLRTDSRFDSETRVDARADTRVNIDTRIDTRVDADIPTEVQATPFETRRRREDEAFDFENPIATPGGFLF